MKVLTLGKGFISDHLPYEKITDRVSMDPSFIEGLLDRHKPDVLINCLGKTGRPNVDWCEQNKKETATANIALPILLAQECIKKNIHLIHIGSGCIYFGPSPNSMYCMSCPGPGHYSMDLGWKEDDFANPKSFYSKTKYACDLALGSLSNVLTLRIRMPISSMDTERNLINKLKSYKQVIDIPNSVTFMDDLARCIDWSVKNQKTGIYHVTNPQPLTAAQIMREYQKYNPDHAFEIMSEQQLNDATLARRSNCIINTDKLVSEGFTMTPSKEALAHCMSEYCKGNKI